jgi:signal transduction histidine kinase
LLNVDISSSIVDQKTGIVQGVVRDVTQRKRMEDELRKHSQHLEGLIEKRTRQLQDAQRMAAIGETTTMVGHDLRNPLQAIVNHIYLAKKRVDRMRPEERAIIDKSGIVQFARQIEEQVKYMNKIVSDLQDYARPVKPKKRIANLEELVTDVLSSITLPDNVEVTRYTEPGLPSPPLDPDMVKRVLTNLATNAVQAMPQGGRLSIHLHQDGSNAMISITDTGTGIAEENLDKVFQPLFTTKARGQGFGLPVCKRLVEAHKGSIEVKSEEGKGSTFTVRLPIQEEGLGG